MPLNFKLTLSETATTFFREWLKAPVSKEVLTVPFKNDIFCQGVLIPCANYAQNNNVTRFLAFQLDDSNFLENELRQRLEGLLNQELVPKLSQQLVLFCSVFSPGLQRIHFYLFEIKPNTKNELRLICRASKSDSNNEESWKYIVFPQQYQNQAELFEHFDTILQGGDSLVKKALQEKITLFEYNILEYNNLINVDVPGQDVNYVKDRISFYGSVYEYVQRFNIMESEALLQILADYCYDHINSEHLWDESNTTLIAKLPPYFGNNKYEEVLEELRQRHINSINDADGSAGERNDGNNSNVESIGDLKQNDIENSELSNDNASIDEWQKAYEKATKNFTLLEFVFKYKDDLPGYFIDQLPNGLSAALLSLAKKTIDEYEENDLTLSIAKTMNPDFNSNMVPIPKIPQKFDVVEKDIKKYHFLCDYFFCIETERHDFLEKLRKGELATCLTTDVIKNPSEYFATFVGHKIEEITNHIASFVPREKWQDIQFSRANPDSDKLLAELGLKLNKHHPKYFISLKEVIDRFPEKINKYMVKCKNDDIFKLLLYFKDVADNLLDKYVVHDVEINSITECIDILNGILKEYKKVLESNVSEASASQTSLLRMINGDHERKGRWGLPQALPENPVDFPINSFKKFFYGMPLCCLESMAGFDKSAPKRFIISLFKYIFETGDKPFGMPDFVETRSSFEETINPDCLLTIDYDVFSEMITDKLYVFFNQNIEKDKINTVEFIRHLERKGYITLVEEDNKTIVKYPNDSARAKCRDFFARNQEKNFSLEYVRKEINVPDFKITVEDGDYGCFPYKKVGQKTLYCSILKYKKLYNDLLSKDILAKLNERIVEILQNSTDNKFKADLLFGKLEDNYKSEFEREKLFFAYMLSYIKSQSPDILDFYVTSRSNNVTLSLSEDKELQTMIDNIKKCFAMTPMLTPYRIRSMIPGITRAHLTMCLYNASNDIICIKHNKLSDNESLYAKVDFVRDINKGWKDVFLEKIKNNPDGIFNYAYLIEELQIADNYLLENDMIAAAMRIFARDAHYTLSKGSGCYRFYSKKEIPFSSIKTAVEFCNSSVDEIRRNPQAVLKKMRDKNVFVTKKQLDRVKMYGEDEV